MSRVWWLFVLVALGILPDRISIFTTLINILDPSAHTEVRWNSGDPIVVLHNSMFARGKFVQGRTFGHVIALSCNSRCQSIEDHELAHVKQHDILGRWYLPAHVTFMTVSWVICGNYDEYNPLEWGPYHKEPVAFGKSENV